jgi:hypothetical protein
MNETQAQRQIRVLQGQVAGLTAAIIHVTQLLCDARLASGPKVAADFSDLSEMARESHGAAEILKALSEAFTSVPPRPGGWLRRVLEGGK